MKEEKIGYEANLGLSVEVDLHCGLFGIRVLKIKCSVQNRKLWNAAYACNKVMGKNKDD